MDSEDERYLEEEDRRRAKMSSEGIMDDLRAPPVPELRLYQLEEYLSISGMYTRYARRLDRHAEGVMRRRLHNMRGVPYHVMRLCDTIKGFHEGSLDLSGRYRSQYTSAHRRWVAFHSEIKEVLRRCRSSWQTMMGPDGKLLRNRNGQPVREQVLVVKPASLGMAFEQKWRLKLLDPTLLGELSDEVAQCMTQHPKPIFQQIRLVDLPSELLYAIMDYASTDGALELGATCKLFRDISLSYVYHVRYLSMKGEWDIDWKYVRTLSKKGKASYIASLATASKDKFLRDAEYLQKRPDIAGRVHQLGVMCWDDTTLERAFPQQYKRQLTFRFSMARGLENALPLMTNLRTLSMSYIAITSAVAKNIFTLPQLAKLTLAHCKVTSKLRRIRVGSGSIEHLVLHLHGLRFDHSPWRLISFLPNLRDIHVSGVEIDGDVGEFEPTPPTLLPYNEVLDTLNPLTLHNLTRLRLFKIAPHEWDRLLMMIDDARSRDALRLTHFKLAALHPLDEDFIFSLVDALETAPLQYLIIDGIQYAEIRLLDRIRAAFPELTSLTLHYRASMRQIHCRVAKWPRASWEYAQAIARFPRLKHFGWNYALEGFAYPRALASFENDYADGPHYDDHEDYELNLLQALFAATCRNLQHFACGRGSYDLAEFQRDGDRVNIIRGHSMGRSLYMTQQDPDQYDLNVEWTG